MKKCAYCGSTTSRLTAEHIVSKSLIKQYLGGTNGSGYIHCLKDFSSNYPTIRDVCQTCNNEILSSLDEAFLKFIDSNKSIFDGTVPAGSNVRLSYNYDLLSKWVLKTLYNSERKNAYADVPKQLNILNSHIIGRECLQSKFKILFEILHDIPEEEVGKHGEITKLKPFIKLGNMLLAFPPKVPIFFIKHFVFSNLMLYIIIDECEEQLNQKIEFLKEVLNESNIYELDKPNGHYIASSKSIIDILDVTWQGDKKFAEHEDKIKKLNQK